MVKLSIPTKDLILYIVSGVLVLVVILGSFAFYSSVQNFKKVNADISALQTQDQEFEDLTGELKYADDLFTTSISELGIELGVVKEESISQLEELGEKVEGISETVEGLDDVSTDFATVVKNVIDTVVTIRTDVGHGSGVIVTEDGYVITNYHVIAGASQGAVYTYEDDKYSFRIISFSSTKDIAIIKIESPEEFDYLSFAQSDNVDIGDRVIAIGSPGGFASTVTQGIVSAVNRKGENKAQYVQTDVPISPGNSGGPLISTQEQVIGINTWKVAAVGFEGIGFALEADEVVKFAEPVIKQHKNDTSWDFG